MKRKILLSFIFICIIILAFGIVNASAETYSYGDLTYKIENDEIVITDCDSEVTKVTIPEQIDGYPVTGISESAFRRCKSLKDVTIADSITTIGNYAFYGLADLNDVILPCSLTQIGKMAFYECSNLKKLYIPENVLEIEEGAYSYCSNLAYIILPDNITNIGYDAFYATAYYKNNSNWENGILYIGNHLIKATSISGDYNIKEGTKSIAVNAFYGCDKLTSVIIPNTVTGIGDKAFYNCDSLRSINIPKSVNFIGEGAFRECDNLVNITLPEKITVIRNFTFSNCGKLKNISIPQNVTDIGDEAFSGCYSLKNINIPNSITSIGNEAFYKCSSLQNVIIPENVISIGCGAFHSCAMLSNIVIPDGIKEIKGDTFRNSGLKSIIIPQSIVSIGNGAFGGCISLSTIYYNGNDTNWKEISKAINNSILNNIEIRYFSYVTIVDIVKSQKIKKAYDMNSLLSVSDINDIFGQCIPTLYKDASFTQKFDLSTPITENITLYTNTKKLSTVCVTSSTGEKIFITTPYLPENSLVILACYKGNKFVEMKTALNKNETIYFVVSSEFDSAKIMAWESLESMTPLCNAETVIKNKIRGE